MMRILATLFAVSLAGPAFAAPYSAAVLADNPYAYWKFDETSGTVAADASGNNRNGTFVASPTLGQSGPLADPTNKSALFNGSSQYVNIAHSFGGVGWTQVTVEAWMNVSAPTNDFQAIVSAIDETFLHFQAYSSGGNPVYGVGGNGGTSALPLLSNTGWHHVAMTSTSGAQRLYLDGTLIASGSGTYSSITPTSGIRIGSGYSGGRFFNGGLDEVAIYQTALSGAQISAHFAAASQVDTPTDVPEPASLLLLGTGLTALALRRRRARG